MRRIGELGTRPAVFVTASTLVSDALSVARHGAVHHLLVRDGERLVGIVGLGDLGRATEGAPVSQFMTAPVRTAPSTLPLDEASTLMRESDIGCLAILEGGRAIGLVTREDLVEAGQSLRAVGGHACASCGREVGDELPGGGMGLCPACRERSGELLEGTDIGGEA